MLLTIQQGITGKKGPQRLAYHFDRFTNKYRDTLDPPVIPSHDGNGSSVDIYWDTTLLDLSKAGRYVLRVPDYSDARWHVRLPRQGRNCVSMVVGSLNSQMRTPDIPLQIRSEFMQPSNQNGAMKSGSKQICSTVRVGKISLLYVPPENLKMSEFKEMMRKIIGRQTLKSIIISDIHRCSEYASDFQICYCFLRNLIAYFSQVFPEITVLGLTTDTSRLAGKDVREGMGFHEIQLRSSKRFHMPNLSLDVVRSNCVQGKIDDFDNLVNSDLPELFGAGGEADSDFDPTPMIEIYGDGNERFDSQDASTFFARRLAAVIGNREHQKMSADPDENNTQQPGTDGVNNRDLQTIDYELLLEQNSENRSLKACSTYRVVDHEDAISKNRDDMKPSEKTNVRIIFHMCMPESIDAWWEHLFQASMVVRRVQGIIVADTPNQRCEADMQRRQSRVPRCTTGGCPFEKPSLCDYGKGHRIIRYRYEAIYEEIVQTLFTLDRLISIPASAMKFFRYTIKKPVAPFDETALYQLTQLGVIEAFYLENEDHEKVSYIVGGFNSKPERRSRGAKSYASRRALHGLNHPAIKSLMAPGRLANYRTNAELFNRVASKLARHLFPVYDIQRDMHQRRLENVKRLINVATCRKAFIFGCFDLIDPRWKCRRCDICLSETDHKEDANANSQTMLTVNNQAAEYESWLNNDQDQWDSKAADAILASCFKYRENIFKRSAHVLEGDPRNIKSLYLSRQAAGQADILTAALDLIAGSMYESEEQMVKSFYVSSPGDKAFHRRLLHVMDDDAGVFGTEAGRRWLLQEAQRQSFENSDITALETHVLADSLEKVDLTQCISKMKKILKEYDFGSFI